MKKYKAYRVAIKFPYLTHWRFSKKLECETFNLDRVAQMHRMFKKFDPFNPDTNVVFVLWQYEEFDNVGKIVAKTDFFRVWEKWMDSVKEVF